VGGLLGWRLLNGQDPEAGSDTRATIPAVFAGTWVGGTRIPSEGVDVDYRVVFVAGSHTTFLQGTNTSCAEGTLKATKATETVLTMRFTPSGSECTPTTAVFTLRKADDEIDLLMTPDEGALQEEPYEANLGRG
jgi:hypothetical protein